VAPRSSPTSGAAVQGTILPSSAPTTAPRGDVLLALVQSSSGNPFQNDTVMIVGLDGAVRAKATFKPRRIPDIGNLGPLLTPEARVAGGKVYYWDGEGVVRSLAVDGRISEVAHFPLTQSQQELSVAVSPDGTKLLAVVLNLPPPPTAPTGSQGGNRAFNNAPFSMEIYSAAPGKPASKISHQDGSITVSTPTVPILQLDFWDAAGPVASYPAVLGTQGGGPHQWNGPLVQLDPNGTPVSSIGGGDCPAEDVTYDATYVCIDRGQQSKSVRVVAPDGRRLWSGQSEGAQYIYAFLAPNHSHIVVLGDPGATVMGADGSSVKLPNNFFHSGWLDDQTIIGSQSGAKDLSYVKLAQPTKAMTLGASGTFVGTL
jgi:hypothetical protein